MEPGSPPESSGIIRRWMKRLLWASAASFGSFIGLGVVLQLAGYKPPPSPPTPSHAGVMTYEKSPAPSPTPDPAALRAAAIEKRKNAAAAFAVVFAKELRASMRDPDSFKLDTVLLVDDGTVCYQYRARNGFGGMNIEQAVLSPKLLFRTSEQSGFARLWNRYCAHKTGDDRTYVINQLM